MRVKLVYNGDDSEEVYEVKRVEVLEEEPEPTLEELLDELEELDADKSNSA